MPKANNLKTVALDIVRRAQDATGPKSWRRLSEEGQMIECRAILCCDILRDAHTFDSAGLASGKRDGGTRLADWWLPLANAVTAIIFDHCD